MLIEFVNPPVLKLCEGHIYKTKSNSILLTSGAYITVNHIITVLPNKKIKVEYQYVSARGKRAGEPFFRDICDVEEAIEKEIFYDANRIG